MPNVYTRDRHKGQSLNKITVEIVHFRKHGFKSDLPLTNGCVD